MTDRRELLATLSAKIAAQEMAWATIKGCEEVLARLAPEIDALQRQIAALADPQTTTWGTREGGAQEMD